MMVALGVVAGLTIGTVNGILLAEALYGRFPDTVIGNAAEAIARRITRA